MIIIMRLRRMESGGDYDEEEGDEDDYFKQDNDEQMIGRVRMIIIFRVMMRIRTRMGMIGDDEEMGEDDMKRMWMIMMMSRVTRRMKMITMKTMRMFMRMNGDNENDDDEEGEGDDDDNGVYVDKQGGRGG